MDSTYKVEEFLRDKYTNQDLYNWMVGQVSGIYFQAYQLAYDLAKRAERALQFELGLEECNYIQFGYWDSLRKGLLAGEKLYFDIKRMETAYLEKNKRNYEITKNISLRQLDPLALLTLKATGSCEVTLPEWLFDLDTPGHYMRCIKNVSLTIPAVTGPYTGVHCTLTLLKSSIRKSPYVDDQYTRQGPEDKRFVDYYGTIQSVVTSSAQNDSGLFETNLHDERYLPFEGAGVISTWRLELPSEFPQFDYNTISDVIFHVRYTAREGGDQMWSKAVEHVESLLEATDTSELTLLFSLKHDFPGEWNKFVTGNENFEVTLKREHFPYFTQGRKIVIGAIQFYAIGKDGLQSYTPTPNSSTLIGDLQEEGKVLLSVTPTNDQEVLVRDDQVSVFLLVKYSLEA